MTNILFSVVSNSEGQHSIWKEGEKVPLGWSKVNFSGTKAQCLEYIKDNWTDIRPNHLKFPVKGKLNSRLAYEKHLTMIDVYKRRYTFNLDSWSNDTCMQEGLNKLFSLYTFKKNQRNVFEIGIGSGITSEIILKNEFNLTGIDVIENEFWNELKIKYGNNFNTIVQDILQYEVISNYDLVIDNGCFHHFEPDLYTDYFTQVWKLLDNLGYFYLSVFKEPDTSLEIGHTEFLDGGKRRCKFFTEKEVNEILLSNQFAIKNSYCIDRNIGKLQMLICITQKA